MKIRISGNSIRFRLSQTEVKTFEDSGAVEDQVAFPHGSALCYRIESSDVDGITASLSDSCVKISIPKLQGKEWCASDQVGLQNHIDLGDSKELRIVVEKDFACLTLRSHEDESDLFPNPNEKC